MVQFTIPGKPFAKQRPRATVAAGRARVYTPKETVSFEIPRSWSKRKQAEAIGQHHTQKPDCDNIEKACADGLSRIAWADDCQVADARCVKRWGRYAETYVQVEALPATDRQLRDMIVGGGAE